MISRARNTHGTSTFYRLEPLIGPAATQVRAGSVVGFSLPLASSVEYSESILDNALWACVSLVVQIGVYLATKLVIKDLNARIERGEVATAIWFGAICLAAGQLAAASMTT